MDKLAKKMPVLLLIGLFMSFFNAFVLRALWNWFAVQALHVPPINFWAMFGLCLFASVLLDLGLKDSKSDSLILGSSVEKDILEIAGYVMDLCLPADKKQSVDEFIQEKLREKRDTLWLSAGLKAYGRVVGGIVTLLTGWLVHTFLI